MTLDEILDSLFPGGHDVAIDNEGLVAGSGPLSNGGPRRNHRRRRTGRPSASTAPPNSRAWCLRSSTLGDKAPLLVLVDSDSQRMSKRDEMLGLSEYLAASFEVPDPPPTCAAFPHRSDCFTVTQRRAPSSPPPCRRALSSRCPVLTPEVMDLPSMSRVTKLSIDVLKEKALVDPGLCAGS